MGNEPESLERLVALQRVLEEHEASGSSTIPIKGVLLHLRQGLEMLRPEFEVPREASIERYKAELNTWEAEHKYRLDAALENFRQTIAFGQIATKYVVLIHGGAAVALLGFIARVWQPGAAQALRPFADSVWWFAGGLVLAALLAFASYVVQLLYGSANEWGQRSAIVLHGVVITMALGTLFTLCKGIDAAYTGFLSTESANELRTDQGSVSAIERGTGEAQRSASQSAGEADTGATAESGRRDAEATSQP